MTFVRDQHMFLTIQRSTVGFSNAAFSFVFPSQSCYPAFFISESRSRLIFSFEFLAFTIQCLRLTFLQQGALMFKVLDVAISDRSFIFCFAYLFIFFLYLFIYLFSEHISTKQKVYFDLSSGHPRNSQLSWGIQMFRFLYCQIPLGDEANCLH